MKHMHITQLRGQIRQHRSQYRTKREGPHFKEDRKSTCSIFGDSTIPIEGFKTG